MTLKLRKVCAIVLSVVMILCIAPMTASAIGGQSGYTGLDYPDFNDSPAVAQSDSTYDMHNLRSYLFEQFKSFPSYVDISSWYIPYSSENVAALQYFIWYDMPESFQVRGVGVSWLNGYIVKISLTYKETPETYTQKYAEMEYWAEYLLRDIKGNNNLSDVEKALLLHDRLGVWNEYDWEGYNANYTTIQKTHTAYAAIVERTAVCQGYAMAYMYLLNQVGIRNTYCRSQEMNHGWNIVYINGVPYHVDVTHDDALDIAGSISHKYFLVSSEAYRNGSASHNVYDFNSSPVDTRYENYCWKNSETAFQLLDNQLYYIDNVNSYLKKYNNGSSTNVCSVSANWRWYKSSLPKNMARLASTDIELLYSLDNGIYSYNPKENKSVKIHTPSTLSSTNEIYGFDCIDGYLVSKLSTDFINYTTNKAFYDNECPFLSGTYTNKYNSFQTINLKFLDNHSISGYYFGKNANYRENTFIQTSQKVLNQVIYDFGTYYITLVDNTGNISGTYYITLNYYNENGHITTGWANIDNTWYYLWDGNYMHKGWLDMGGTWYYFNENGAMVTGWAYIGNAYYYFNPSGAMQTGWVNDGGTWYYMTASGAMATGWQLINYRWYYMNENGAMRTGWLYDNGTYYYFNASGLMATGWLYDNGTYYYLLDNGAMATGWQLINYRWYYFNQGGAMATGWQYIDGTWYYFHSGGNMATGWLNLGGTWYYMLDNGAMATGWQWLGNWYYFNAGGVWIP